MEWCVSMPKIELHAHLNGSIRDSTLLELARELGEKGAIVFSDVEHVILKSDRSLNEVFKLFDLIHIITTDHKTVARITKEVIEDFAADNVIYLELRTTPKRNDSKGMSKRSYMEAVLEGIRSVNSVEVDLSGKLKTDASAHPHSVDGLCNGIGSKKIYVRLLLSIDRRETAEAAMETVSSLYDQTKLQVINCFGSRDLSDCYLFLKVELAVDLKDFGVVGIDLSGNPNVGQWMTFLPALEFAKKQGLPITLHCGEVPNSVEIRAMLDFLPGRIGHACCFEDEEWKLLQRLEIPVEICLTSNIKTETIASADVHHFADLYKSNHPLVLCTDDCGVFSTSLSAEYALASSAFDLGEREMFQLAQKAIDFIFASGGVKEDLKTTFASALTKLNL
ncbi:N6-mAMP deaminase isoform X2 [Salvia miltiorrhiza]|nr:N6-mAMP deaminase isoform X2 [Salvia miltiorrhiza]